MMAFVEQSCRHSELAEDIAQSMFLGTADEMFLSKVATYLGVYRGPGLVILQQRLTESWHRLSASGHAHPVFLSRTGDPILGRFFESLSELEHRNVLQSVVDKVPVVPRDALAEDVLQISKALMVERQEVDQKRFFFKEVQHFIARYKERGVDMLSLMITNDGVPTNARYYLPYLLAHTDDICDENVRQQYLERWQQSADPSIASGARDGLEYLSLFL